MAGSGKSGQITETTSDGRVEKRRVIFWNVSWGMTLGVEEWCAFINESGADYLGFSEVYQGLGSSLRDGTVATLVPGYQGRYLGGGMALFWRKELSGRVIVGKAGEHWAAVIAEIDGERVALVDLASDPRAWRGKSLPDVFEVVKDCDVVMGDFNTPYRSAFFDPFRAQFQCGNTAGFKNRATWPQKWPLLALDHLFLARDLSLSHYQRRPHSKSDHLQVWAEWEKR